MKNVVRLAIYNRQKYGESNEFTTHLEVFKRRWETEPEISVVGVFCDVCFGTAKYEEKAELKKLLEKCKSGDVDIVAMQSVSRLSRDTRSMIDILKKFHGTQTVLWFEKEKMAIAGTGSPMYSNVEELLKANEMRLETLESSPLLNIYMGYYGIL